MQASIIDMRAYCSLCHSHSDCTLILIIVYEYMNMDMKQPTLEEATLMANLPNILIPSNIASSLTKFHLFFFVLLNLDGITTISR